MMKKIFNRLTFYSLCAILAGIGVVAVFSMMLSTYGESQEPRAQIAAQNMPFPKNEEMLNKVSEQLAREGAALSAIEPAAGNK